jgi:hypothetical protein
MAQVSFGSRNPIINFIVTILVLYLLYKVATWLFWALAWASPFLLIFTLIIDKEVVVTYLKSIWNTIKATPFLGIIYAGLSFFGMPVVIFYLFGKAMLRRQAKKFQQNFEQRYNQFNTNLNNFSDEEEGFTTYEEVTDNLLENDKK